MNSVDETQKFSKNEKLKEKDIAVSFIIALAITLVGCSNSRQLEAFKQSPHKGSEPAGTIYGERNFAAVQRHIFNAFKEKYANEIKAFSITNIELIVDVNEIDKYISALSKVSKDGKEKLKYEFQNGQRVLVSYHISKIDGINNDLNSVMVFSNIANSSLSIKNNDSYYTSVGIIEID